MSHQGAMTARNKRGIGTMETVTINDNAFQIAFWPYKQAEPTLKDLQYGTEHTGGRAKEYLDAATIQGGPFQVVFSAREQVFTINGKHYNDLEITVYFNGANMAPWTGLKARAAGSWSFENALTDAAKKKLDAEYAAYCLEYAQKNLQAIMQAEEQRRIDNLLDLAERASQIATGLLAETEKRISSILQKGGTA